MFKIVTGAYVKAVLPSAPPACSATCGSVLALQVTTMESQRSIYLGIHLSTRTEVCAGAHWDRAGVQSGDFCTAFKYELVAAETTACNFCACRDTVCSFLNRAVVDTSLPSGGLRVLALRQAVWPMSLYRSGHMLHLLF